MTDSDTALKVGLLLLYYLTATLNLQINLENNLLSAKIFVEQLNLTYNQRRSQILLR